MSQFKIMYVVHSLGMGGVEKLVYDMVIELKNRDAEPMVCCLDYLGVWGEDLKNKGFKIYDLKRKNGLDLGLARKMKDILNVEHPDILHPHQYTPYFYSVLSAVFAHRPKIVFTEHGRFFPDGMRVKRAIFNQFANLVTDEIIGVSEFSKRALVEFERFPGRRIKVIYNGIREENFSQTVDVPSKKWSVGLDPRDKVVGTVGRLCREKNHKMLIRALGEVKKRIDKAKLVIIGEGELGEELKKKAREADLDKDIIFLGPRQDIPELLKTFDVFVLSSDSEGASLVLLEAMASGLPVVATQVGGNCELIKNGKTGISVPRGDYEKFSAAVISILEDPAMNRRMGEAGKGRVHEKFTFQKMVDNYIDIYRGLLTR